jgi:hypothetical protein
MVVPLHVLPEAVRTRFLPCRETMRLCEIWGAYGGGYVISPGMWRPLVSRGSSPTFGVTYYDSKHSSWHFMLVLKLQIARLQSIDSNNAGDYESIKTQGKGSHRRGKKAA